MQALMTGLTRIPGIDLNNQNPISNPFVLKELTQLVERPTIRATALGFVARLLVGTFSDSGQVLNGDDRIEHPGFVDDFGTDAMVEPSLIAAFPSRQPLQQATTPGHIRRRGTSPVSPGRRSP